MQSAATNAHTMLERARAVSEPSRHSTDAASEIDVSLSILVAVVNAHTSLASPCALNSAMFLSTALATQAAASDSPIDAIAQVALARSCSLHSPRCHSAACQNSKTLDFPAIAYAHAVIARPCTVKSPSRYSGIAQSSAASEWPARTNAHAMLATCCAAKSLRRGPAVLARPPNTSRSA
eukprot:gnl/TRDRNA2_/TRDRNA2_132924_c0_seq1.p1 gnl/TRDRNA2_/TRDRNA2_132924_c0~~gnl/TRDRNA2_/TRDRNA2_132924_c0_seq1.p1  ORF type:complete len:179 (+),score=8.77 gnl/TRDRNA2_/TRDRNA2_132924_c0_seq1:34-570(+)